MCCEALVDRFVLLFKVLQLSLELPFLSLGWCELLLSIPEWLPGCFDLELTIEQGVKARIEFTKEWFVGLN